MFKAHPKGLIAAALANMGERFGFYTMMAILVLFLQAKFGLDGTHAGYIYATFYFLIYILAFVGGLIADKKRNYKGIILLGIILMGLGYMVVAFPTPTPVPNMQFYLTITCIGLFIIAFGNGLFKGNLQALVGQMYDNEKYTKLRDSGFSIFYMFINVGAIFAPFAAIGVRNWWLGSHGLQYNSDLPALCHSHLGGTMDQGTISTFQSFADVATGTTVTDLTQFANNYLDIFSTGFHYAFAVAIFAMAISLVIYILNKKKFPDPKKKEASDSTSPMNASEIKMGAKEVKQRLLALLAVFAVVIFFWFSFHQNGLTLTFFARDYTLLKIGPWSITAEIFQSMNPFFVVFLTPVVLAFFKWLRSKGKEPSTPRKIAIGMFIAALGYVVMSVGSIISDLPLQSVIDPDKGGVPLDAASRVTPFLLMGTYLVLTVAELFISPLGISFVSKVAPPQYQGVMQGGWLGATAIGNQLLFIGAVLYESIPLWMVWSVFVGVCLFSMIMILLMVKWLERVSGE